MSLRKVVVLEATFGELEQAELQLQKDDQVLRVTHKTGKSGSHYLTVIVERWGPVAVKKQPEETP